MSIIGVVYEQLYLACVFSLCSLFLMSGQAIARAGTAAGAMPTSTMNELLKEDKPIVHTDDQAQIEKESYKKHE